MSPIRIRPATAEDCDGIARVYIDSAEHHAAIDPERCRVPSLGTIREMYRTGGQHPQNGMACTTYVAEIENVIAGFVDVRLQRSPDPMYRPMLFCHINEIGVASECRSQGIGELLMRAAEEWGREKGANLVSLEYNGKNPRAASFYERNGYEPVSIFSIKWL